VAYAALASAVRVVARRHVASTQRLRAMVWREFFTAASNAVRVDCAIRGRPGESLERRDGRRGRVSSRHMSELERSLLRRLRDRDERAFRELVDSHRDRVFNITYRMLGHRAEAEDVAQEVFITVFKTIDAFREESKFSTWLYRVTVNHCKNRIKYLARRRDRDRDELDETSTETNGAAGAPLGHVPPDRALAGAQLEVLLQEAIANLDDDHRVVVVLRDIEDLSIEEICDITGLPDGTVKSRLHRARLALRKRMQRHV
jgi:RNA polymerase sigma-70 factor (ECF subfamily)